ncbi:methyltransferase [Sphingomonas jatrophae]|uniref:Malonyl-CoA O-methyltransferase n=1 Tax=Sphingomonas jatrophae TaxID=1166337 RepID=A0A1I6JAB1_9SPHN|nr:methyltransferase [Sphingomonas jatrophae]SFR75933.1 malonyl-CoA O-methyltransferase [Sphingomonas jatrophae]
MNDAVARAFDRAADYDRHAQVQREVAGWLADTLVPLAASGARILEVGCGTGFVAAAALPRLDGVDWLMTDIADGMLARARARLGGQPGVRFGLTAGDRLNLPDEAAFDLVCSSLAAQWFDDLPGALAGLMAVLRPGGTLLVTTLMAGTFAEWQRAHAEEGLSPGTPDYPSLENLSAIRPAGASGTITPRTFVEPHRDAASFLRSVRAIGAGTPRPGHRSLGPAALRRVTRRFEATGAVARYEVALCRFDRPLNGS